MTDPISHQKPKTKWQFYAMTMHHALAMQYATKLAQDYTDWYKQRNISALHCTAAAEVPSQAGTAAQGKNECYKLNPIFFFSLLS